MGHFTSLDHLGEVERIVHASRDLFTDPSVLYCYRVMGGTAEFHPVTNQYRLVFDPSYDTDSRKPEQFALLDRYPWEHVIFGPKQERFHTKMECIFAVASSISWFMHDECNYQPDYRALEMIISPLTTLVPPDQACTVEWVGTFFSNLSLPTPPRYANKMALASCQSSTSL